MKKVATILLLGILLFNWSGYRLLGYYLEDLATNNLETRLNSHNYEESDLISVKIPAKHLSFYTNTTAFERFDGQIEIAGIQYSYVKCRISSDSIEMLCIPNRITTQLKKGNNEFFKLVNGIQHTGQGKKAVFNKNFSSDYYSANDFLQINHLYYKESVLPSYYAVTVPSCITFSVDKPPDRIS